MKCRCSLVNRKKTHGCDILCEKIKDQRNIFVPLYCEIIGLRCSSVVRPLLFSPSTLYCIRWLFIRHSSMVPVEKKPNHRQNSHTLTHSLACSFERCYTMCAAPITIPFAAVSVRRCMLSYETNAAYANALPKDFKLLFKWHSP